MPSDVSLDKKLEVANARDELDDLVKNGLVKIEDTTKLLSTKSFLVKLESETLLKYFEEDPEKFLVGAKHSLRDWIRQFGIPIDAKEIRVVIDSNYLVLKKMRELKSDSYYKPVVFDAVVVGEGSIKTYIKKAVCFCPVCTGKVVFEVNTTDKILEPFCQKCKEKTNLCEELCQFGDLKDIILREPFGDSVDKQPIEWGCKVRDELVNRLHVGKKIRIVGSRRAVIGQAKKNEYPIEVRIFSEEDLGDPKDLMPSEAEIEFYDKEAKKPDFENDFVNSFAPDVYCTKESLIWYIKYALLLLALGGNETEGKRQYINEFLVGDPGTAKSTMMRRLVAISPRSMYISGNGASEAGLTAIIEKQPDGKFMAKAGLLPMCDGGGIAAVDEMNLMKKEDQDALQEASENQFVTKAKAANIQMPARCSLLGGANPVFGKYDKDKTVIENTGLSVPLLNRFDLKFNVIDEVDPVLDTAIAKHIIGYQKNPRKILDATKYSNTDVIKILNSGKKLQPQLTDEVEQKIIDFVNHIRALTKSKESMPVDKRIIESLVRLVIARAKFLRRNRVILADVEFISKLYLKSLESFGIDTSSNMDQRTFNTTREMNIGQTWWDCWAKCMDEEESVDEVELLAKLAETKYFDEFSAKNWFKQMHNKGVITEKLNGRWRKV